MKDRICKLYKLILLLLLFSSGINVQAQRKPVPHKSVFERCPNETPERPEVESDEDGVVVWYTSEDDEDGDLIAPNPEIDDPGEEYTYYVAYREYDEDDVNESLQEDIEDLLDQLDEDDEDNKSDGEDDEGEWVSYDDEGEDEEIFLAPENYEYEESERVAVTLKVKGRPLPPIYPPISGCVGSEIIQYSITAIDVADNLIWVNDFFPELNPQQILQKLSNKNELEALTQNLASGHFTPPSVDVSEPGIYDYVVIRKGECGLLSFPSIIHVEVGNVNGRPGKILGDDITYNSCKNIPSQELPFKKDNFLKYVDESNLFFSAPMLKLYNLANQNHLYIYGENITEVESLYKSNPNQFFSELEDFHSEIETKINHAIGNNTITNLKRLTNSGDFDFSEVLNLISSFPNVDLEELISSTSFPFENVQFSFNRPEVNIEQNGNKFICLYRKNCEYSEPTVVQYSRSNNLEKPIIPQVITAKEQLNSDEILNQYSNHPNSEELRVDYLISNQNLSNKFMPVFYHDNYGEGAKEFKIDIALGGQASGYSYSLPTYGYNTTNKSEIDVNKSQTIKIQIIENTSGCASPHSIAVTNAKANNNVAPIREKTTDSITICSQESVVLVKDLLKQFNIQNYSSAPIFKKTTDGESGLYEANLELEFTLGTLRPKLHSETFINLMDTGVFTFATFMEDGNGISMEKYHEIIVRVVNNPTGIITPNLNSHYFYQNSESFHLNLIESSNSLNKTHKWYLNKDDKNELLLDTLRSILSHENRATIYTATENGCGTSKKEKVTLEIFQTNDSLPVPNVADLKYCVQKNDSSAKAFINATLPKGEEFEIVWFDNKNTSNNAFSYVKSPNFQYSKRQHNMVTYEYKKEINLEQFEIQFDELPFYDTVYVATKWGNQLSKKIPVYITFGSSNVNYTGESIIETGFCEGDLMEDSLLTLSNLNIVKGFEGRFINGNETKRSIYVPHHENIYNYDIQVAQKGLSDVCPIDTVKLNVKVVGIPELLKPFKLYRPEGEEKTVKLKLPNYGKLTMCGEEGYDYSNSHDIYSDNSIEYWIKASIHDEFAEITLPKNVNKKGWFNLQFNNGCYIAKNHVDDIPIIDTTNYVHKFEIESEYVFCENEVITLPLNNNNHYDWWLDSIRGTQVFTPEQYSKMRVYRLENSLNCYNQTIREKDSTIPRMISNAQLGNEAHSNQNLKYPAFLNDTVGEFNFVVEMYSMDDDGNSIYKGNKRITIKIIPELSVPKSKIQVKAHNAFSLDSIDQNIQNWEQVVHQNSESNNAQQQWMFIPKNGAYLIKNKASNEYLTCVDGKIEEESYVITRTLKQDDSSFLWELKPGISGNNFVIQPLNDWKLALRVNSNTAHKGGPIVLNHRYPVRSGVSWVINEGQFQPNEWVTIKNVQSELYIGDNFSEDAPQSLSHNAKYVIQDSNNSCYGNRILDVEVIYYDTICSDVTDYSFDGVKYDQSGIYATKAQTLNLTKVLLSPSDSIIQVNAGNAFSLDSLGLNTQNWEQVVYQNSISNNAQQQWMFIPKDGSYLIKNKASNEYLTCVDGEIDGDSYVITRPLKQDDSSFLWKLKPGVNDNSFVIQPLNDWKLALRVNSNTAYKGGLIVLNYRYPVRSGVSWIINNGQFQPNEWVTIKNVQSEYYLDDNSSEELPQSLNYNALYAVNGNSNSCYQNKTLKVKVNYHRTICSDVNPYLFEGFHYQESGTYATEGFTLNLELNPVPQKNLNDTAFKCNSFIATLDAGNPDAEFLWNTGESSQEIRTFDEGLYTVNITNSFGCSILDSVQVVNHPDPIVDLGEDIVMMEGDTAVLSAGDHFWRYTWSHNDEKVDGPGFNSSYAGTQAGKYALGVRDTNLCPGFGYVNVSHTYSKDFTAKICENEVYTWDGRTYESEGKYPFLYQTINGHDSLVTLFLETKPAPEKVLMDTVYKCSTMVAFLNAGNDSSEFVWSNGETTQEIRTFDEGLYTVNITNSFGCSVLDSVQVVNHPDPVVDLGDDIVMVEGDTAVLSAGDHFRRYTWSHNDVKVDGPGFNSSYAATQAGKYALGVRDTNFCPGFGYVNVSITSWDTIYADICAGDVYEYNGEQYSEEGIYTVDDTKLVLKVIQSQNEIIVNQGESFSLPSNAAWLQVNYLAEELFPGVSNNAEINQHWYFQKQAVSDSSFKILNTSANFGAHKYLDVFTDFSVRSVVTNVYVLKKRNGESTFSIHISGKEHLAVSINENSIVTEPYEENNDKFLWHLTDDVFSSNHQSALTFAKIQHVQTGLFLTGGDDNTEAPIIANASRKFISKYNECGSTLTFDVLVEENSSAYAQKRNVNSSFEANDVDVANNDFNTSVYPNPAHDMVNVEIELPTEDNTCTIQIFDMQGRLVFSKDHVGSESIQINTKQWNSGTYYIKTLHMGEMQTDKLVIIR
jgi:hypothetical protein